ncbi:MAG: hypothetical protein ACI4EL_09975 [Candidatus Fimimorpha sp.]
MKKILAVYDIDQKYAQKLTDYLNRVEKIAFHMIHFTSIQSLEEYAKEHLIHVLLINQEAMREEIRSWNIQQILYLTDVEGITEFNQCRTIYKYQSAEYMVRELMDCYEALLPPGWKDTKLSEGSFIIGVYSPVRRCMKTSFCLAMGMILAETQSVMYLNLEEMSGLEQMLGQSFDADLSDALFYYSQDSLNRQIHTVIDKLGKLDFIPPVRYIADKEAVTIDNLFGLIQELERKNHYDTIIIDIADGGPSLNGVLKLCKKIYMPICSDFVSKAKIEEFEHMMEIIGEQEVLKRIEKIELPKVNLTKSEQSYEEQLLWGEFGDYIRNLIR